MGQQKQNMIDEHNKEIDSTMKNKTKKSYKNIQRPEDGNFKVTKRQLLPAKFILNRHNVIAFKKGGLEIGFFELSDIEKIKRR